MAFIPDPVRTSSQLTLRFGSIVAAALLASASPAAAQAVMKSTAQFATEWCSYFSTVQNVDTLDRALGTLDSHVSNYSVGVDDGADWAAEVANRQAEVASTEDALSKLRERLPVSWATLTEKKRDLADLRDRLNRMNAHKSQALANIDRHIEDLKGDLRDDEIDHDIVGDREDQAALERWQEKASLDPDWRARQAIIDRIKALGDYIAKGAVSVEEAQQASNRETELRKELYQQKSLLLNALGHLQAMEAQGAAFTAGMPAIRQCAERRKSYLGVSPAVDATANAGFGAIAGAVDYGDFSTAWVDNGDHSKPRWIGRITDQTGRPLGTLSVTLGGETGTGVVQPDRKTLIVRFPSGRTVTGVLVTPSHIHWDNGDDWTK
jgi:hypothetical protein